MTELTPQKRAELRRLAEACPDDGDDGYCLGCQMTIGQCCCPARYALRYVAKKPLVLSLLDALDAAEAELASVKADPMWARINELGARMLADIEAQPVPELTAVEIATQSLVDAAVYFRDRDASESSVSGYGSVGLLVEAVDALRALRKEQDAIG